jgi:GntR family transcriptional regulator
MGRTSGVGEPAYKALAGTLRDEIRTGAFPPSKRLPTDAELSRKFGLSRQTVRQAFGELVAEGLVYRVRGRGSFAVGGPDSTDYLRSLGSIEDILAVAKDVEAEMVEPFAPVIDVAAASRLRLRSDHVFRATVRRLDDNVPFAVSTVYIPPELGTRLSQDPRIATPGQRTHGSITTLIDEISDHPLVGTHQSITAVAIDPLTAPMIGCKAGDPGLQIERTYFDAIGNFVELALSTFNPTRYSYRLELRRNAR